MNSSAWPMLGIAIMAYNRPAYLARLLETLAQNDLTDCDVHLWQDGPLEPEDNAAVDASAAAFEAAPLPRKTLHRNDFNLCCAAQRYQLMPWMAARYETFLCLDNDIVLSPYAVTHLKTLLAQYAADPRVGSVSPGFKLECPAGQQDDYRDKVILTRGHFWCEGYWTAKWTRLWGWYEQYYDRVKHLPYRAIGDATQAITHWNRSLGLDDYTANPSSDVALARALILSGYQRLRLVVNRATGIGDHGLHCTPGLLAQLGAGHQPLYTWPDEASMTRFVEVTR